MDRIPHVSRSADLEIGVEKRHPRPLDSVGEQAFRYRLGHDARHDPTVSACAVGRGAEVGKKRLGHPGQVAEADEIGLGTVRAPV